MLSLSILSVRTGRTSPGILVKSYQNGVSHNKGRFVPDILLLFSFAQS